MVRLIVASLLTLACTGVAAANASDAQPQRNRYDEFMSGVLAKLEEPRTAEYWVVYVDDEIWASIKTTSVTRNGVKREFIGHINMAENPTYNVLSKYSFDCSKRTYRATARVFSFGPTDQDVENEPEPEQPVKVGSPAEAYFDFVCDDKSQPASLLPRPIHRADAWGAAKVYWNIMPLIKKDNAFALIASTADPIADGPTITVLSRYLVEPKWNRLVLTHVGIKP